LEYEVKLLGLPLGTAHIATWGRGTYRGQAVTEYRAWIEPAVLVSALVSLEASAYALVPDRETSPLRSLVRYTFRGDRFEEQQLRSDNGLRLTATHAKNGKRKTIERSFSDPTLDYLTGFLLLRRLPEKSSGCTIVYADRRAYTVWIVFDGQETLSTNKGEHSFDRYQLKYGSDRAKEVHYASMWMTRGPDRIPFQARGASVTSPFVRLSGYRRGR
jgi:hypothetical protein